MVRTSNESGSQGRILVADESTNSRELLQSILEGIGYSVHAVASRHGVLDAVRSFIPHLVLLDIPYFDGNAQTLLSNLRSLPECRHVPLVALSASTLYPEPHLMTQAGFAEVLPKPISPSRLREVVRRHLGTPQG